jgi:2-C-methyl-D-erythritol 4-phosphate cytidylyltransferase
MSYYALVAAAGGGQRMGLGLEGQPKQYFSLCGHPVLHYALSALCATSRIDRVFVVLAPDDHEFCRKDWGALAERIEPLYCGGSSRAASVRQGIGYLRANQAMSDTDWLLVHDAARACLLSAWVNRLIDEVGDDPAGGLLALPVSDTLKRAQPLLSGQAVRVRDTVDRNGLWQAQTPQMFRVGVLWNALQCTEEITDEAAAVEMSGYRPILVRGEAANVKLTYPHDVALVEAILKSRDRSTT